MKIRFEVSPEMVAFLGGGALPDGDHGPAWLALGYRFAPAMVSYLPDASHVAAIDDADIIFLVTVEACTRIFGCVPPKAGAWHLPSEVRGVARAVQQGRLDGAAAQTLRHAKCIELLCVTFEQFDEGRLIPTNGADDLSAAEAERIADARRLIDERWNEKLTLDAISRACGINRATLTRGFRSMFAMSVGDAIADRRLGGARDLLLATDLPVSSIGYRCGYLNNASFTRAFSRRYGKAPTQFRAEQVAA
ncbi:AraC family transcriptional regulator [Sphingomonas sp. RHCKR47]|nr:AraC family transcriptional regulator [Sphingomonas citricola]